MFFVCIGTFHYQLGCRMSVDGIVHLILNFLEEQACCQSISVIVYARGIYIRQLLIETTLTQANLPYLGKQSSK